MPRTLFEEFEVIVINNFKVELKQLFQTLHNTVQGKKMFIAVIEGSDEV